MPIDPMMLGPMLDSFKNMANECTEKGHSGPAYDRMMAALKRMETLGEEMDDFMAYSAKISAEGLQMEFSTAYGEVLTEAAKANTSEDGDGYDDKALLQQNLDALRQSIEAIKKGVSDAEEEAKKHLNSDKDRNLAVNEIQQLAHTNALIAPIEKLIELGESGINFPTFLRLQIEKGMDKAMSGQGLVRNGLEYELDFAKAAAINPYAITKVEEALKQFDYLAEQATFDVPDSLAFELVRKRLDHQYTPLIERWQTVNEDWSRIFSLLDTWAIAHCTFAPSIDPWAMSSNPSKAVLRDKETLPGVIRERIQLLSRHFQIDFSNIFNEETFIWDVRHHHFPYSQKYTELLIRDILPHCQAGQVLDKNFIQLIEQMYQENEMANPENYKVLDRQEAVYDQYFGSGLFVQKFGEKPDYGTRNAPAWSI